MKPVYKREHFHCQSLHEHQQVQSRFLLVHSVSHLNDPANTHTHTHSSRSSRQQARKVIPFLRQALCRGTAERRKCVMNYTGVPQRQKAGSCFPVSYRRHGLECAAFFFSLMFYRSISGSVGYETPSSSIRNSDTKQMWLTSGL